MAADLPRWRDAAALTDWLARQRNDLEAPATALAPGIGAVLTALRGAAGCDLARMSGSGATCFGLFQTRDLAEAAAAALAAAHPGWWVRAVRLS
jgi:4-diphosphocytidyl-2-C-methyl-D-erythritol kinase